MTTAKTFAAAVTVASLLALGAATAAHAQDGLLGEGMTIYMQMGGTPGDGATLPRTNGARAAAQHFGAGDRRSGGGRNGSGGAAGKGGA